MSPRLVAASLAISTLAIPGIAFGLLASPSSVLQVVENHTGPRRIVIDGYLNIADEDAHMSMHAEGAFEGKKPENMKMKLDVHVEGTADGDSGSALLKLIVHQKKLYMQIAEFSGEWDDKPDDLQIGQWYWMDIAKELHDQQKLWEEIGKSDDMSEEDVKALIALVHDAIFQMDWTLFDGGASYKLTLRPDALFELATRLCGSGHIDCDQMGVDLRTMRSDPEVLEIQRIIRDNVNLSYKIDTDRGGNLQFARMYLSVNWPDTIEGAVQGELHMMDTPVYLDIPTNAISLDDLKKAMERDMYDNGGVYDWAEDDWKENNLWQDTDEWDEDEWTDEDWDMYEWDEDEWEDPAEDIIWDTEWDWGETGCTAEPGTLLYLQQMRRGECATPSETRPGRGSLRNQR